MDNKKEFLTEENYESGKKKLTKVAKILLIVGLVIGIGLIAMGVVLQNNAKITNEALTKARLEEIEIRKTELNNQIQTKEYSCNSLDMMAPNWFADKNKCQSEVSELETELSKLEIEEFNLKHTNYTFKYIIFYIIGGMTIFICLPISGIIYIIAKRREIMAFTTQQTMPVAQEGIEKFAPTIGKAGASIAKEMAPVYGEIAKEISKGIKEGINEADRDNNNNN